GLRGLREVLDRTVEPERVKHGDGPRELRLRLRGTRGLEVHLAEPIGVDAAALRSRDRCGKQRGEYEHRGERYTCHEQAPPCQGFYCRRRRCTRSANRRPREIRGCEASARAFRPTRRARASGYNSRR